MASALFALGIAAMGLLMTLSRSEAAPDSKTIQNGNADHKVVRLWEGSAPGAQGTEPADIPTLTIYNPPADKANGAAFVVCPGGGYGGLADHEGRPIAEWLNTLGVTGYVLKYRLGPKYHHPVEMGDVARAIRMVRANAKAWGIDPHRIGVIGFSAGGHLASTTATHFDDGNAAASDPIDRVSSRPDLAVLAYAVITMTDPFTHSGSRHNLLGDSPPQSLIDLLSNEKQVTPHTPPCFLFQTADDPVVPCENSLMFAMACHKAGVPVELHMFEHGAHGVGLATNDPILSTWTTLCAHWMEKHNFFKPM